MRDLPLPTMPLAELRGAFAPQRPPATARPRVHPSPQTGFEALWARHEDEVREAQRLRYLVFAQELGARLPVASGTPPGHDIDAFDPYCEHLLVRATGRDGNSGPVVGTYRVLTPAAARRVGGLYSETEFDLANLQALRPKLLELGRSCVHPDWRTGGAIFALWSALAEFMLRNGLDATIGCASVSMHDGGNCAASLWHKLRRTHLAPPQWQVQPRLPLPVENLQQDLRVQAPPLLKGYLRCGAKVLGPPAWDPDFNTADLPLLMRIAELPASYRRRFLHA